MSSPAGKKSSGELLPRVYRELRRLAAAKMAREKPGQTLQPTALVHEAYLRLGGDTSAMWDAPGHFYAAAAEAMRRILIERARRQAAEKYGGGRERVPLDEGAALEEPAPAEILALDRALQELDARDPTMASVVKLRYFAGLTVPETADALSISPRSVNRCWTAARTWLYREIHGEPSGAG